MHFKKLISFSVVALIAVGTSLIACSSSSTDAASCDQVCATVGDCGSSTCLAACINIRTACNAAGQVQAFNDFASCGPVIACEEGAGYAIMNCPLPQIELSTLCKVSGMSTTPPGTDGGLPPGKDAATDSPIIIIGDTGIPDTSGDDSGDDASDDSGCGVCQSTCEDECGEPCTGGDCVSSDDGSCGVCQSDCENDCGECTGGDCVSSDDGSCGVCQSDCEDECGETCTGGDCVTSDDTGSCGTCGSDCEDDCGDSCTGGDCCTATCSNCTTTVCEEDEEEGIECTDSVCGTDCC